LNHCPVLLEYIQLGKATRNPQNMVILSNGDHIPSDPENHPWAAQINEYYDRNPHLLPQETVQANFSANLLKLYCLGSSKEENSSLFAHLESINEEDEVLGLLRGKENLEEAELGRHLEVLQARKNKMVSGKKKMDPLKPVLPEMDQPNEVLSDERTYRALLTEPLLSTPVPPIHAPIPQFKFAALIELKVNASSIINQVLSEKSLPLSQRVAGPGS